MAATLLDGKRLAQEIQAEFAARVQTLLDRGGRPPCLAAVLVGEDPASEVYVRNKRAACQRTGMASQLHRLEATATTGELLDLVEQLNADPIVDGILVQLPLPEKIDAVRVLDAVDPAKDVDAFHPHNVGLLSQGRARFLPCTPHGVQQLLARYQIPTAGRHVVIVGRSDIVGKPLALMLLQRGADATVTVCHSQTKNLAELTREADILVAAVGRPRIITADMVKPGAAVIDVGINRTDAGLVGDVDFEPASQRAGWLTPVPGGVGPLTVTMLLWNTLAAREQRACD